MTERQVLLQIASSVKQAMKDDASGHDWYHIKRVYAMAGMLVKEEKNVDSFVVLASALLHDMGDWKIRPKDTTEEEVLRKILSSFTFPQEKKEHIIRIITHMSYSANLDQKYTLSVEGKIVQDADRLDALGAIGIARAFAYGGRNNRVLYDPLQKPKHFTTTKAYRSSQGPTINHFYEKLFLLKEKLHTKQAKKIAMKRELYMRDFLTQFFAEWEAER